MTAVLRLVDEPDGRPTTTEALEDLLTDDDRLWEAFEGACRAGLAELRNSALGFRAALLAGGHVFGTLDRQFEETFEALLGLAEEYLPDFSGAARPRLRERVRDDVNPRPGGGVNIVGDVSARRAVEVVLAHEDRLFDEFVLAASVGHARLYAVAWLIREGLAATGREYPVEAVEDELWIVARELLPNTPAARPDTGRQEELWARAQEYVLARDPDGVLGDQVRQGHEARALEAVRDHDPTGYRDALRELCRAARDASREGDRNGGDEDEK